MLVLMFPRVSSRVSGFPVASPYLWGKLQNLSFSKVSKQVVMSFCKARAALCDISTCLIMCRKLLCVAGRILLRRLHKMSCSCSGAFWRSLSSFCVADQHFRRFGLPALHSTLYAPQSTLCTPHNTLYTPHFNTLHFALHTVNSAPHSTLCTIHSTLHILYFTSTLNTLHITL